MMSFTELKEKLTALADAFPGKTQIIFQMLETEAGKDKLTRKDGFTVTGDDPTAAEGGITARITAMEEFRLHAGDQVVSASMIKVPILCCLLETLRERGLMLQDTLEVNSSDILSDSDVFETGPREISFYELGWWMIVNSDNTAANVLMQYLGFERINEWCAKRGLTKTRAERLMLDYEAVREGRNNYISPEDYAQLVLCYAKTEATIAKAAPEGQVPEAIAQQIADGWHPAVPDAKIVMDFLRGNRDYDEMLRYIWEQPVCAHKTGELDTVVHDAGIFTWHGCRWFLGIFTSDFETGRMDYVKARSYLALISRAVFDYCKTRA